MTATTRATPRAWLGLAVLALPRGHDRAVRVVALAGMLLDFVATLVLVRQFVPAGGMQFVERVPWVESFGIEYHLGVDGINLWRSPDLKRFEFVKQVWTPDSDPARWYNHAANRLFWAPELHYINGTYWIAFCLNAGDQGKIGVEVPFCLSAPFRAPGGIHILHRRPNCD